MASGGYQVSGSQTNGTEVIEPWVAAYSGGNWVSTQEIAPPSHPAAGSGNYEIANLDSIACAQSKSCTAVGEYRDSKGNLRAQFATTQTGAFPATADALALPSNVDAGFPAAHAYGVSCPTTTFCGAAGSYIDTAFNIEAMGAVVLHGHWVASEITPPSNAVANPIAVLKGVSCANGDACEAVGEYDAKSNKLAAMVVSYLLPGADQKLRDVRAQLSKDAVPRGKDDETKTMLDKGQISEAFKSPEAGALKISWIHTSAKNKRIIVAIGQIDFAKASEKTIDIKLTDAGRSFLKDHQQPVLSAVASFLPSQGKAVDVTKSFELH